MAATLNETLNTRLLVDAFYNERTIVNHHLASFNDFLQNRIQSVVENTRYGGDENEERGVIQTDIEGTSIRLGRVIIGYPEVREADGSTRRVTPMEARLRNLTYCAPVSVEFTPIKHGIEQEPVLVQVMRIPIMARSSHCNLNRSVMEQFEQRTISDEEYNNILIRYGEDLLDPGGYFVVNGTERVLITMEDLAPNRVMVEKKSRYGSDTEEARVFSLHEGYRARIVVERKKTGELTVATPNAGAPHNLIVLLRALGMETAEQIFHAINVDNDAHMEALINANIEQCDDDFAVLTKDEAIQSIGRKLAGGQAKEYRNKRVENLMDNSLLPHLGKEPEDRLTKALFLARMARSVLQLHLGQRNEDDKDHYANKRLSLAGDLMEEQFRNAFGQVCKDLKGQLESAYNRNREMSIKNAIRSDIPSNRIQNALSTGAWTGGRKGVSQLLDRISNLAALSHMRRVTNTLGRTQPQYEARDLHSTHWGRLCPNETPEGANCGLVKNLSLMVEISEGFPEREVRMELNRIGMRRVTRGDNGFTVLLNGDLVGLVDDPEQVAAALRKRRREGGLSSEVNVRVDKDLSSLVVNSDKGRVRRPLIVVEKGKLSYTTKHTDELISGKKTWSDLINEGILEYIDAEEEENLFIALSPSHVTTKHTHCEIDPLVILGIGASLVPYPEHNSSPRITMGAGMGKQSLGFASSNYRLRPDTRGHLLHYPQAPMVQNHAAKYINFNKRPAGQNFVVAVMSFHGYNMEDAIVMNKSSIERGLGRSSFFRTYSADERRFKGGQEERFERPTSDTRGFRNEEAYGNLDEHGFIELESRVEGSQVLIGKTSPPNFLDDQFDMLARQPRRETSETVRSGEKGYVDSLMLTEATPGNRMVKIRVRDERIPELGDKFASKHGQKGVIGLIVPQEGMPFDENGVNPDIIINPHAIPSRMTVAHVLEMIGGLVGSMEGRPVDGTAFSGEPEEQLRSLLMENGFKHNGKSIMHDGQTGRQFQVDIFMGCIYYQKLHHMVAGKIHARSRGPVQSLTRQPTEGRARDGGLRFGEMERDALIGHGAAMVIKDRLLDNSDHSVQYVDNKSGFIAMLDRHGVYKSLVNKEDAEIYPVEMSYAFKLLMDEIMSLTLAPRLRLGGAN